jgi:hypothetical protein
VDGILNASGFVQLPLINISNTADFTVGKSVCVSGDLTQYFTGLLDEIAVYNSAASAVQIKAIYDSAAYGKCMEP